MQERRDSGAPSEGGSHATALTWATSSGGKTARATRARSVLEPLEALLREAFSPPPNDLGRHVEPASDLNVGHPARRIEHQLGSLDLPVRAGVASRHVLELATLPGTQSDP